jgi:hypothetical protein
MSPISATPTIIYWVRPQLRVPFPVLCRISHSSVAVPKYFSEKSTVDSMAHGHTYVVGVYLAHVVVHRWVVGKDRLLDKAAMLDLGRSRMRDLVGLAK